MTREELYEKYHRLAWKVARIMQRSYRLTEEDVEDIAMAALAKLVTIPLEKIDARGHKGYARTVINNAARTELKSILKGMKLSHYEDAFLENADFQNEAADRVRPLRELEDSSLDLESPLIDNDTLTYYLSTLTEYERKVVDLLLGSADRPPMHIREIAKALGETQKHVEQVLERTYIRVRKRLEQ